MNIRNKNKFVFLILTVFFITGESAATVPSADIRVRTHSIGFDMLPGLSISYDYGLRKRIGLGGSVGLFRSADDVIINKNLAGAKDRNSYFESHIIYQLVKNITDVSFSFSVLAGFWMVDDALLLQAGALFDVPLSKDFNLKFNFIVGPRTALEISYHPREYWEICIGLGDMVGILGARFYFNF